MRSYSPFQNFVLLVLRLIIAAIFLVAAYHKIPFWKAGHPEVTASMLAIIRIVSIAEPLGAIAMVFGLLTRLAAFGLTVIMVGAVYYSKFVYGIGFVMPTGAGWNFPLMVLGGCVILVAFGAGDWSVENKRAAR